MAGKIVMAIYRPKPGRTAELESVLAEHVPALRREGLATARPVLLLRSPADGSYVEIFEWISEEASAAAHENAQVMALWQQLGEAAELIALAELAEAGQRFAHFDPMDGIVL
jgi:quinol monooxygenase YgiN